jgi:hypothetical protein
LIPLDLELFEHRIVNLVVDASTVINRRDTKSCSNATSGGTTMNGRKNNFLIPVATVVLAASLIGLGVSVDQLFFSAQPKAAVHIAAGSAGGNASKVLSPTANVLDNPANNPQNNHQSTAINNQPNNRVNSRSAYSIFHPPPVVSEHLHGILNSKLSYPMRPAPKATVIGAHVWDDPPPVNVKGAGQFFRASLGARVSSPA